MVNVMNQNMLEAGNVFQEFMEAYVEARDLERSMAHIAEDVTFIGTRACEEAACKAELYELLKSEIASDSRSNRFTFLGMDIKEIVEGCVQISTYTIIRRRVPEHAPLAYKLRQTAVLRKDNGQFYICSLHFSVASNLLEADEDYAVHCGEPDLCSLRFDIRKTSVDLLNSSIPGGMIGGYIEEGFPLYFINQQMLDYIGYTYDEFIADTKGLILNSVHPDDRDYVSRTILEKLGADKQYEVQYRMLKKNEGYIWVLDRGLGIITEDGRNAIISVCTDISEIITLQRQLEDASAMLWSKKHELEQLTNNIPSGILKFNADGDYAVTYISDGFINLTGYSRGEIRTLFNNSFFNLIYPADAERVKNELLEQRGNHHAFSLEFRVQKKNGSVIWVLDKCQIVQENECDAIYGVLMDITETKIMDATIKSLTANIPCGVCEVLLDDAFTLIYGNEAFYSMCGYTPQQLRDDLGNHLADIYYPENLPKIRGIIHGAYNSNTKSFEFESRMFRRDCSVIWILTRGTFTYEKNHTIMNCVVVDITDRKFIEDKLRISEERFRIAFSKTSSVLFDYDMESKTVLHADRACEIYGLPQRVENVPESLLENGTVPAVYAEEFLETYAKIRNGAPSSSCTLQTRISSGKLVWTKITLTAILDNSGRAIRAIGILEDVTKQRETELAFAKEEQYRVAMLSDALIYYEVNITKNLVEHNQGKWELQFGNTEIRHYTKLLEAVLMQSIQREDRRAYKKALDRSLLLRKAAKGELEVRVEHRRRGQDGTFRWMLTTMHLIEDSVSGDVKGFVYIKDIDEQKREALALEYRSQRDSLTQLYNKGATESRIKEILSDAREGLYHAFMIIDVDHFKEVNDTHGHQAGDAVLSSVAHGLTHVFRRDDILGRIGGDEFVIFVRNIHTIDLIEKKAQELCILFRQGAFSEGYTTAITCSIGISFYDKDGKTFEELYQTADTALYKAKTDGRDRFVLYDSSMQDTKWQPFSSSAIDSDAETL